MQVCDSQELKALLKVCPHPLYLVVLGLDSSTLTDARRHLAALACSNKVSFPASLQFARGSEQDSLCWLGSGPGYLQR